MPSGNSSTDNGNANPPSSSSPAPDDYHNDACMTYRDQHESNFVEAREVATKYLATGEVRGGHAAAPDAAAEDYETASVHDTPVSIRSSRMGSAAEKQTAEDLNQAYGPLTPHILRAITSSSSLRKSLGSSPGLAPLPPPMSYLQSALDQHQVLEDDAEAKDPLGYDTVVHQDIREMMRRVHLYDVGGGGDVLDPLDDTPSLGITSSVADLGFVSSDMPESCANLKRCMDLRDKYMRLSLQIEVMNPKNQPSWKIYPPPPNPAWKNFHERAPETRREFHFDECDIPGEHPAVFALGQSGIYNVYEDPDKLAQDAPFTQVPSIKEFYQDLEFLLDTVCHGPTKTFAFRRMRYLEARWQLYHLLNERAELHESKMVPHRDFYNVRKVDTHVHLAACMNQKHLLRFIKYKLKTEPNRAVLHRDGKNLTLKQVFESLKLTAYDLSIDTLDMHAHKDSFHRFDKFNLKYNPIGESRLRTIFLKTDNDINGEYFAQITKEVISDLEASKYQMAEYRVSIYGRSPDEWDRLAAWVVDNKVFSSNVRWLIQTPRLYNVYKENNQVKTFEDVIRNIFAPLFEVTKDPSSHPKLHVFLQRVVGFDSVDDESKPERRFHRKFPLPRQWDSTDNPPYTYYCYFTLANMCSLNQWRARRGFNTFVFRPHAGEAGDTDHLGATFLSAQSISHGILLRKVPALLYLYYLKQVGIAMSPLSNNALFLAYERNPFLSYLHRGMNVSLSTDDPLQFHFTKEPLIEEYSIAANIWKLSGTDMCELAYNSVRQSGFEAELKKHWVGREYLTTGRTEMHKTNVPMCRIRYRNATLAQEQGMVNELTKMYQRESSVSVN